MSVSIRLKRTVTFDPEQFNTIGVKLAQKAKVPIIPLALKTNAWGNGKVLKDFGCIDTSKTVHFAFGEPIEVQAKDSIFDVHGMPVFWDVWLQ